MATFLLTLLVIVLALMGLAAGLLLSGRPLTRGCARAREAGESCDGCTWIGSRGGKR